MQGLQYRSGAVGSAPCKKKSAALQVNKSLQRLESSLEAVQRLASENAVLIFSMSSCCMCHVVKRLLCSLGVNSVVNELDEEDRVEQEDAQGELHAHRDDIERSLFRLVGQRPPVSADCRSTCLRGMLLWYPARLVKLCDSWSLLADLVR